MGGTMRRPGSQIVKRCTAAALGVQVPRRKKSTAPIGDTGASDNYDQPSLLFFSVTGPGTGRYLGIQRSAF